MNEPTIEERKILCKLTGQCWHEAYVGQLEPDIGMFQCIQCGVFFYKIEDVRPTFTTWEDLGKVFQALVGKDDLFREFLSWSWKKYINEDFKERIKSNRYSGHIAWLFQSPAHFCKLAASFAGKLEGV
ncbi:MAG: hypothetical protein ABFD59_08250 [Smithella sp.]